VLGVLLTLMARTEPPKELPPEKVCPPPSPCPVCGGAPAKSAPRGAPIANRKPPTARPLPELQSDPEGHRERLRSWFESSSDRLADCVAKGEQRRRLLLQMKIEPDGEITDAAILGADDLPPRTGACVKERVTAMRAPRDELRGRETLVVYVNL
jgi:hypothetical protein